jgi:hypothetical protein
MNRDEYGTKQPSRVAASYWYSATESRAGSISCSHHLLPSSLVLFLLVALPTICVKVPPAADYVNHLARSYIIAFGSDDPFLSTFYTIQWKLVPNLAIDLIVPPLAHIFGIFNAGKLFLLSYMALVLSGSQVIHYALFRKFSLGPLVAALFIYNGEYRDGIVNYLFGVGLALWGVAAWIALRRAHALVRLATSLAFVVALFICHLGAVGLYGLGLLTFELWLFFNQGHFRDRQLWTDMGVFFAPFLTVPVLMASGPTVNFVGIVHWSMSAKIYGLTQVIRSERLWVDFWIGLAMAVALGIAWRFGRVRVHPIGWALLAVAVPVYLLMPHQFLSANDVDVRIPIGVLFLGIGMLQWNLPMMRMQYTFLAVVLLFALVRVGYIATIYLPFRNVIANLEESLQQVARGSRVMIAHPHDLQQEVFGLFYLPCLAMIERSSLVSIAHSHPAQQVLTVRPAFREFTGGYDDDPPDIVDLLAGRLPIGSPPGKRLYWKDWTKHYDYLYLIWAAHRDNPAPDLFIELYEGRNFRLYRVAS